MHRRGTLLIVVAGLAALLATLALAFAFKVRSGARMADNIARVAQARMMLNAAVVYSLYQCDYDTISLAHAATDTMIPTALVVKNLYIVADSNDPSTFNTAWFTIAASAVPNTLSILAGAGPSQGSATATSDDRKDEPRYTMTLTLLQKTSAATAPSATNFTAVTGISP